MSLLRHLSRMIHPEAWDERKRYRAIRRLVSLKLRAEGRGDKVTALRAKILLNQIRELGVFNPEHAAESNEVHQIVQRKGKDVGPIHRPDAGRPFMAGPGGDHMADLDAAHPKGRRGS